MCLLVLLTLSVCTSALSPISECTISRTSAPLSLTEFRGTYKGRQPVIFPVQPNSTSAAAAALSPSSLLLSYGHLPVTLASSNSNSYAKHQCTLSAYLASHLSPVTPSDPADRLWYLFGDTLETEAWSPLHATFPPLPLDAAADDPIVAWGVGGLHSGVPFHRHGAVYAQSILGSKQWWVSPPATQPAFHGNHTQLSYALQQQASGLEAGVLTCAVAPGEAIYIPSQWWHATLNLHAYTAFTSVFVREASGGAAAVTM